MVCSAFIPYVGQKVMRKQREERQQPRKDRTEVADARAF